MAQKITEEEAEARRVSILSAARWCFLNLGFAKTSLDDIAKRANITPVHRVPAMVLEPWRDMVGAPTAAEFYNVCERVSPEVTQHHRQVVLDAIATILKHSDAAAGRAGAEHRPQRVRGPDHAIASLKARPIASSWNPPTSTGWDRRPFHRNACIDNRLRAYVTLHHLKLPC